MDTETDTDIHEEMNTSGEKEDTSSKTQDNQTQDKDINESTSIDAKDDAKDDVKDVKEDVFIDGIFNGFPSTKTNEEDEHILEQSVKNSKYWSALHKSYPRTAVLLESIRINIPFYVTLFLSIYLISRYTDITFKQGILGVLITSLFGWLIHIFSHEINYSHYAQLPSVLNEFTTTKYISNLFLYFSDFHDRVHHGENNHSSKNMALEFIGNIFFEGIIIILLKNILQLIPNSICIFWGLLYAISHIVTYTYYPSESHQKHHQHPTYNYGFDIWDIILGTKKDISMETIENENYKLVNMFFITPFIIYFMKKINI